MTATTLGGPEPEEAPKPDKQQEHPVFTDGNGVPPAASPPSRDSELQNLNEQELKAAIKSAWKKHERLAKKDMAPLLYWLRVRLRAPGSRNDIHDKDRGFGAWVEDNLEISRATADRWADWYATENGLKSQEPTSPHMRRGCKDPDFYKRKLARRGKGFTLWVKEPLREQYKDALNTVKKHFKITDNGEAVVKGLSYAAEAITAGVRAEKSSQRPTTRGRRRTRVEEDRNRRRSGIR